MKDYVICLVSAALVSAVCTALASGAKLERYVKYICALVCVACVALPLLNAFPNGIESKLSVPETEYTAVSDTGYFQTYASGYIEEYIKDFVFSKTGITPAGVRIEINRTERETVVGDVTVTLSYADSGAAGEIRSALENGLGIKADVEVEHAADGG